MLCESSSYLLPFLGRSVVGLAARLEVPGRLPSVTAHCGQALCSSSAANRRFPKPGAAFAARGQLQSLAHPSRKAAVLGAPVPPGCSAISLGCNNQPCLSSTLSLCPWFSSQPHGCRLHPGGFSSAKKLFGCFFIKVSFPVTFLYSKVLKHSSFKSLLP